MFHFSALDFHSLHSSHVHTSSGYISITRPNITANVYKRLIYTLQQWKYLYNLQNNLETLNPLARLKLRGQELDHGLKLNILPEREKNKSTHHFFFFSFVILSELLQTILVFNETLLPKMTLIHGHSRLLVQGRFP